MAETSAPAQPPSSKVVRTSESQLFCCKSIDKLISDSEEPEHALKKTLGPWSLTALGIGAVIGSGIFTVIGTAISGEQFDTSSILNTPLADFVIRHTAMAGRPGAGPRGTGRGRGILGARGGADRRSGAPHRARPGRGTG